MHSTFYIMLIFQGELNTQKNCLRGEMYYKGVGVGRHLIAELYECNPEILDNVKAIREALVEAAERTNSTVLTYSFHRFKPHGISGYVLVAESHLSIHTWPEYGYAAVDVFTCGDHTDPHKGLEHLAKKLGAKKVNVIEVVRGIGVEEQYKGFWKKARAAATV